MAKLSARGRHCEHAFIKETHYPPPYHSGEYSADFRTEITPANEIEWRITKIRIMSDGHVLRWEKWKHFKHTEPFVANWKDNGKIKSPEHEAEFIAKLLGKLNYTRE